MNPFVWLMPIDPVGPQKFESMASFTLSMQNLGLVMIIALSLLSGSLSLVAYKPKRSVLGPVNLINENEGFRFANANMITGITGKTTSPTPVYRTSRIERLRGGASVSISGRLEYLLKSLKSAIWSCVVCFLGLNAVGISMMIFFYVIAFFLSYIGIEMSQSTIALFSLMGSVMGSMAGGATVGHLAAWNPSGHAALVGAAFVILQLRQLVFFEGMPIWYTLANLVSYVPCAVYSARWSARRRALKQKLQEAVEPASDTVIVDDATNTEAATDQVAAEKSIPNSDDVAAEAAAGINAAPEGGQTGEAPPSASTMEPGIVST